MHDVDTELLRVVQNGDMQRAGTLLVTEFADEVFGLCRAMVRDPIAAEDLSQDVFGRAFSGLPSFRGEASARTWLLRIARNRCIDHIRAQKREPHGLHDEGEPDDHAPEEPDITDLLERQQEVQSALDALDESERALVVLRFGHGLGYAELAGAFGLREGTVRMRVSRAVTKMREALTPIVPSSVSRGLRRAPAAPGAPAPDLRRRKGTSSAKLFSVDEEMESATDVCAGSGLGPGGPWPEIAASAPASLGARLHALTASLPNR